MFWVRTDVRWLKRNQLIRHLQQFCIKPNSRKFNFQKALGGIFSICHNFCASSISPFPLWLTFWKSVQYEQINLLSGFSSFYSIHQIKSRRKFLVVYEFIISSFITNVFKKKTSSFINSMRIDVSITSWMGGNPTFLSNFGNFFIKSSY